MNYQTVESTTRGSLKAEASQAFDVPGIIKTTVGQIRDKKGEIPGLIVNTMTMSPKEGKAPETPVIRHVGAKNATPLEPHHSGNKNYGLQAKKYQRSRWDGKNNEQPVDVRTPESQLRRLNKVEAERRERD